MTLLQDLERQIAGMSGPAKAELDRMLAPELGQVFLPNPGPQTDAYCSQADILLFGGSAGGGKTALMVGTALRDHHSALILRREAVQLDGLFAFAGELVANRGWDRNKVEKAYSSADGRTTKFAGLNEPDDWRKYAGIARDFYGFDEAGEFLEEQVSSLLGWLRTTQPGQRCRVILASNPPRGGDGRWLLVWFAPWLDPLFPDPALPGELRWAIRNSGTLEWVAGPGEYERDGDTYVAQSYTFIPSRLEDNPYLADSGYRARLQNLPEPLRSQLLHGNFLAGKEDSENQVIPSWAIAAAQARWVDGINGRHQIALACDIAQGGADKTTVAALYDGAWFDRIKVYPGSETPDGPSAAAKILMTRRDGAVLGIDMTGGWGGSARDHLRTHNGVDSVALVASAGSAFRDKESGLEYANLRAQMWWEFRKDLCDPACAIALPPSQKLAAELSVPMYFIKGTKIWIEMKDDIRKRLGSSTDEADAVLMAWYIRGKRMQNTGVIPHGQRPKVKMAYANMKKGMQ